MGYDLHITRRNDWCDEGADITSEEWIQYVSSDPELKLTGDNGPYFAEWNGHSKYPDAWFNWSEGQIYTKNPDKAIVDKMIAIAKKLSAKVQGDDGEDYADSSQVPDPDEPLPISTPPPKKGFFSKLFGK